jgi:large repetitive protein
MHYTAGPHYDMASGLGTPIASGTNALVPQLCNRTPAVSSVSPTSGPQAGGQTVTIDGAGFLPGATVAFGTTAATAVQYVSHTQLTATVPPGTGTVDVIVTTSNGTSATGPADQFSYNAPPPPPVVTATTTTTTQTTSAQTPALTGPKPPALSLTLRQNGNTLTLGSLSCSAGCSASALAYATVAVAAGHGHKRHMTKVNIGSLRMSQPAGSPRHLTLTLSAAGRKLLARLHTLSVTVTITVSQPRLATHTTSRHLTLHSKRR